MENILTLGKLLSLWFCFLLHSILFLISQTSYRTYKIISSYELAHPIMGTIFLVFDLWAKGVVRAREGVQYFIRNFRWLFSYSLQRKSSKSATGAAAHIAVMW